MRIVRAQTIEKMVSAPDEEGARVCRTIVDYDEIQRRLFQLLRIREEHKASCRRCAACLHRGKSLPKPLPQLPDGRIRMGSSPNSASWPRQRDEKSAPYATGAVILGPGRGLQDGC